MVRYQCKHDIDNNIIICRVYGFLTVFINIVHIILIFFTAYQRRATIYKHLGKHQAAIDDLKKVLQAEPDNSIAKVRTKNSSV